MSRDARESGRPVGPSVHSRARHGGVASSCGPQLAALALALDVVELDDELEASEDEPEDEDEEPLEAGTLDEEPERLSVR